MNIKALIISSHKESDKMYDCEISIPALKIHIDDKIAENLTERMPHANYTSIMFMVNGNPVEVPVYKNEKNDFYANAKKISELNLTRMPLLKENTLVKKYLESNKPSKIKNNM